MTLFPPLPLPPSDWRLDLAEPTPGEDLVAAGADLNPATVVAAYRLGLFPMGLGHEGRKPLGWWSPDPRGVLTPGAFHTSRSLRRSLATFDVRVDTAFADVVAGCANPSRPGRWITKQIAATYTLLHELGWAHSIETWREDELVGGVYGVSIGGLFAGESMFHTVTDASKVALHRLVQTFFADGDDRRLIDVQWATPHLRSLGVHTWPREVYLRRLAAALGAPQVRFSPIRA